MGKIILNKKRRKKWKTILQTNQHVQ